MEPDGRRGSTSATSTIHGEILHFEAVARQARDRFQELTRGAVPHVNPLWGRRWLLKELFRNGYRFERNAKSGDGVIYRNQHTGEAFASWQASGRISALKLTRKSFQNSTTGIG